MSTSPSAGGQRGRFTPWRDFRPFLPDGRVDPAALADALESSHLAYAKRRDLLFGGLPVGLQARLPTHSRPAYQALSDLRELTVFESARTTSGGSPLATFLANAAALLEPRPIADGLRAVVCALAGKGLRETAIRPALRWIAPGVFRSGSPLTEAGRRPWETPRRRVIERPFLMTCTPITARQFTAVLGVPLLAGAADAPRVQVDVEQARRFCDRVSRAEGLPPVHRARGRRSAGRGSGFRLPTEWEWEFACRAGGETPWWTGQTPQALPDAAWYRVNSGDVIRPVAQRRCNPWGLYDMHGNVWEWTDHLFRSTTGIAHHVIRGGAFDDRALDLRSAVRLARRGDERRSALGFRMVRTL